MDELDEIGKEALKKALSTQDEKERVEALGIAKTAAETRKMMKEMEKIECDVKEAFREYKFGRTKVWAATLTPLLAVALTGVALILQSQQFRATANVQIHANEESQWRDAVNKLSMKNPGETMVSAFAMHNFFDSRHGEQARIIAATLLPHVDNPDGFDNVFFGILHATNTSNEGHILGIGKTLFNLQMDLYRLNVLTNQPALLDFHTLRQMLGDDDPPDFIRTNPASRRQAAVTAWMLASTSDGLRDLWGTKAAAPERTDLNGVVLERGLFHGLSEGLDFSDANLQNGALYHADFRDAKFVRAAFTRRLVSHVMLDGADLSGVKEFEESKWEHANWWKAKCISKELVEYLEKTDKTASPEAKKEAHAITCH